MKKTINSIILLFQEANVLLFVRKGCIDDTEVQRENIEGGDDLIDGKRERPT